jgi:hypothetical protein
MLGGLFAAAIFEYQADQYLNDGKYEALFDKICEASSESIEMTTPGKRV